MKHAAAARNISTAFWRMNGCRLLVMKTETKSRNGKNLFSEIDYRAYANFTDTLDQSATLITMDKLIVRIKRI